MCEDCSSSRPNSNEKSTDYGRQMAFFSWVKKMGLIKSDCDEKKIENGEINLKCSCCDITLNNEFCSPYLVLKPSWGVLDYTQKGNLITEELVPVDDNDEGESSDPCKSDCPTDRCDDEFDIKEEKDRVVEEEHQILSDVDESVQNREETEKDAIEEKDLDFSVEGMDLVLQSSPPDVPMIQLDDASLEMITFRSENCFDFDVHRFIPVELIDSTTLKNQDSLRFSEIEDVKERDLEGILSTESKSEKQEENEDMGIVLEDTTEILLIDLSDDVSSCEKLESMDMGKDEISSSTPVEKHGEDPDSAEESDRVAVSQATKSLYDDDGDVELVVVALNESDEHSELKEEGLQMSVDETESKSLIVKEISDQDSNNYPQAEEQISALPCSQANPSSTENDCDGNFIDSDRFIAENDQADEHSESKEEGLKMLVDETESGNLIDKEMPDQVNDHSQVEEQISSLARTQQDYIDSDTSVAENDQDSMQAEEVNYIEDRTVSVERIEQRITHHLSISSDFNEVEEDRAPETPTYVEGLHHLHKKLLLLEKKESGTEESLDGSVISETENGEGNLTVEKLKSALKAEHKALSALYAELEEERSASAIAANQTMAMITRLQEEKAAMQMEALQYQRMMEEQSEYDQEALQLLNELMVKREKEKQELEKELEVYRRKVLHYEAKEKKLTMKRKSNGGRSGTSSTSSSNAADSDELSVDLNHENADEYSFYSHQESSNHNTPTDGVLNLDDLGLESSKHLSTLDESLADFEEERQSILEQLKALEEKLFTLGDDEEEEEELFEDMKPIEHFSEGNGKEFNENYDYNQETNGEIVNGHSDDLDEKHYQDRRIRGGSKAKKLLPLFDAIDMENEEEFMNEEHEGPNAVFSQNSSLSKFTPDEKKLALVEEVDHVYERLHALEADREFLKHCISSLKKGDKGMDLLQEILQHLRDLRSVELRVRNMGDASLQ
ncbi:Zein-binding domain [Macleaya cordata]|uniref:Zein-binding domain n=1 Tax=Macleaya cordata TaxID=56857 RepID=A0A200PTZ6_MACCD|nr:Zein-binding domain [Macleaya cordata]